MHGAMRRLLFILMLLTWGFLATAHPADEAVSVNTILADSIRPALPLLTLEPVAVTGDTHPAVGIGYWHPKRSPFNILGRIKDRINEPFDTTRDANYWRRAWSHFKIDLRDETIPYPKFLNVGVKVYRWLDKNILNTFDPEYVTGLKKKCKVVIKTDSWIDSYLADIENTGKINLNMSSRMVHNVGFNVSFFGFGYSYMFDLDNVLGGDKDRHHKRELSFTCSRFSIEYYRTWNVGMVDLVRVGEIPRSELKKHSPYDGVARISHGVDAYYFFNHRKYSQAAAYGYGKLQLRSAGSPIGGFLYSDQFLAIDFTELADEPGFNFKPENNVLTYECKDYTFMLGYAYNWVFKPKWLFNVTLIPAIGWRQSSAWTGHSNSFSFVVRGRLGLVRQNERFFYALQILTDSHLYRDHGATMFYSTEYFDLSVGFKF